MNFEWFLASRYFREARKGARFLSFIKIMAIGGVAIGSAGLLITLSIVHGFKSVITDKVLSFSPHIEVVSSLPNRGVADADTLLSFLNGFEEIEASQAVIVGQAMIQTRKDISGTVLKGVNPDGDVTDLKKYIVSGEYNLLKNERGLPGLVIGQDLADEIGAQVGSTLTVYTLDSAPSQIFSPELQQFHLAGIYKTGIDFFDNSYALVDRVYAQKLLSVPSDFAHSIEVRLKDTDQIESFDARLSDLLTFRHFTQTAYESNSSLFAWVGLMEEVIPLLIAGMVLVAAFNLIGAILMMVLERTRDIGILKTMGAKNGKIRSTFMAEGFLIASVGVVIGMGISTLFTFLQSNFGIIKLSEKNYYMSTAPVEPHFLDFIIVVLVTYALCILASYLPARIASKTDPIKVISFGG